MSPEFSLVIACFNEEPHLAKSVAAIEALLATCDYSYELIFIDDCSRDGTVEVIKDLVANSDHSRAAFHDVNVGRGGTVTEGIRMAKGRLVGFLDIDLEVSCEHIPTMLAALEEGNEVASALRHSEAGWSWNATLRFVLSRGYRVVFRALLSAPLRDTEAGYKFFQREAILPVLDETENEGWFWDTEVMVLAWLHGLRIVELPCPFVRRADKASTVRVVADVRDYLKAIFKFRRRIAGRLPPR